MRMNLITLFKFFKKTKIYSYKTHFKFYFIDCIFSLKQLFYTTKGSCFLCSFKIYSKSYTPEKN